MRAVLLSMDVSIPAKLRNQIILKVRREIADFSRQSLHLIMLKDGRTEPTKTNVPRIWNCLYTKKGESPVNIESHQHLIEVIREESLLENLLIVGPPGSGKTSVLLELAEYLIQKAEADSIHPIPIILNLYSWHKTQSLEEWLIKELVFKGISERLSIVLLREKHLIPILDGMDELEADKHVFCVQAINQYLKKQQPVVVCSCAEEYETVDERLTLRDSLFSPPTITERLKLHNTLHLLPSTDQQIEEYLNQLNDPDLKDLLKKDKHLSETAKVPFLLNILAAVHTKLCLVEWKKLGNPEERQHYLINTYIKTTLDRNLEDNDLNEAELSSARDKVQTWLVCLAQMLKTQSKVEFLVENLQPALLETRREIWQYRLLTGLVFGSIGALVGALTGGMIGWDLFSWIGAKIGAVAGAIIFGVTIGIGFQHGAGILGEELKIKPVGNILWPRIRILDSLKYWFIVGTLVGLIGALGVGLSSGIIVGLIGEWLGAKPGFMFGTLIGGLFGGLTGLITIAASLGFTIGMIGPITAKLLGKFLGPDVEKHVVPNREIHRSAIFGMILGIIVMAVLVIFQISDAPFHQTIAPAIVVWPIVGLIAGFFFGGGEPVIQHFILRGVLWKNKKAPWNYVAFLNDMTTCGLLQKTGAIYRFPHPMLRTHFEQTRD